MEFKTNHPDKGAIQLGQIESPNCASRQLSKPAFLQLPDRANPERCNSTNAHNRNRAFACLRTRAIPQIPIWAVALRGVPAPTFQSGAPIQHGSAFQNIDRRTGLTLAADGPVWCMGGERADLIHRAPLASLEQGGGDGIVGEWAALTLPIKPVHLAPFSRAAKAVSPACWLRIAGEDAGCPSSHDAVHGRCGSTPRQHSHLSACSYVAGLASNRPLARPAEQMSRSRWQAPDFGPCDAEPAVCGSRPKGIGPSADAIVRCGAARFSARRVRGSTRRDRLCGPVQFSRATARLSSDAFGNRRDKNRERIRRPVCRVAPWPACV